VDRQVLIDHPGGKDRIETLVIHLRMVTQALDVVLE
jgi:ATP-dependent Zn protease